MIVSASERLLSMQTPTNNNLELKKNNFNTFTLLSKSNSSKTNKLCSLSSPSNLQVSRFESTFTLQTGIPAFSIPKQERFKGNYKKVLADNIYNLPEMKTFRGTTLGLGEKSNFIQENNYPSPQSYLIKSLFEDNLTRRKGVKIGEKFNQNSNVGNLPGPQTYTTLRDSAWRKQSPTTLKFRHGFYYDEEMKYKGDVISPQKYAPSFKFAESKRYNDIKIGIGLGSRNRNSSTLCPGPGAYNLPSIFDKSKRTKYPLN